MRLLLTLLAVGCLLTASGCAPTPNEWGSPNDSNHNYRIVEFNGHTYVEFVGPYNKSGGIVHDPDCKCGGE